MKNKILNISVSVLLLILSWGTLQAQDNDQCFKCHSDLDDEQTNLYKADIHHLKGISCSGCHGGDATSDDMEIAMSKDKEFIGVPLRSNRYQVCVNCHSDENKMKRLGSSLPTDHYENLKR